ncbi:MAG: ZIP family metal transporter [Elusimicrobia bacterium]|jgi:ZIP family zinc transporter|nr:ZIP family metal transporter [Elusimicrobiota bacterium]
MTEYIGRFNPVLLAFFATTFTWFLTAVGAMFVFFNARPSRKVFDCSLGFAGGVMVAASFFSLLLPAIEISGEISHVPEWVVIATGFVLGCLFLYVLDRVIPHLHLNMPFNEKEGPDTNIPIPYLLVLAITLHNIPEGLAVGVAFGSTKFSAGIGVFLSAISLTFAIGLQNIPEGMAVAIPLRSAGLSKAKAFFYGQLSGLVEIAGGLMGVLAVSFFYPLLPYALSFAAGAMIYVVVEEVIPETQRAGNTDIATLSFLLGFLIMMILDTALL